MTVDKEAILDSMMLKGGNTDKEKLDWLVGHTASLLKEIAELKDTVQKLSDALASTMTPNQ